jgi:hypothetical protein
LNGEEKEQMNSTALKAIILGTGLLLLFCRVGHPMAQEPLLFDLKRVADRPAPDVEKILGKPSKLLDDVFRGSRGSTYPAIRATYMNGAIEVTYLEGGARYLMIWVQKLSGRYRDYSYPKDGWTLLGDLGLDRNTTADLSNQVVTRWRDLPGIYEINVFPTAEKKLWYVHVLINRIYQ